MSLFFTGDLLIEREKQRLQELRQKAAEEVRAQWEERKQRENSINLDSPTHSSGTSGSPLPQSPRNSSTYGTPLHLPVESPRSAYSDCASVSSFESIEGYLDGGGYISGHSTPSRSFSTR